MGFKLHTTDLSPFGQRAKLALAVKGLLAQTDLIDTFGGTDALGTLAPMRQIPILEHDGFVLPESQTIVDYLDALVPSPPLLPADSSARATARLLARIADLYIAPHFLTLIVGMRPPNDPDKMAAAIVSLNSGLSFAEHYLTGTSGFAVEPALSLADLALAPFLFYVPKLTRWHDAPAFPDQPKTAAYLGRLETAPYTDKAFAEMETAYKARTDMLKD